MDAENLVSKTINHSRHPITERQKDPVTAKMRKVSTFTNKNSVLRPDWLGINQSGDSCGHNSSAGLPAGCISQNLCVCVRVHPAKVTLAPQHVSHVNKPQQRRRADAVNLFNATAWNIVPANSRRRERSHGRRTHQLQS